MIGETEIIVELIDTTLADVWLAFRRDSKPNRPSYGGTRMIPFTSTDDEALTELKQLALYESHQKHGLINHILDAGRIPKDIKSETPGNFSSTRFSGGRCVFRCKTQQIADYLSCPETEEFNEISISIFEPVARRLNELGGKLYLTPDFGQNSKLADILWQFTPYVLGVDCSGGGCGGKSSYTVSGFIGAFDAVLQKFGLDFLKGPVTLVGSAGAVGTGIREMLAQRRYENVAICDLQYDANPGIAEQHAEESWISLPSIRGKFTNDCLKRGGVFIAATWGNEFYASTWQKIPNNTIVLLAHNNCLPENDIGDRIVRELAARGVVVVPGQALTFGGAATSRLEKAHIEMFYDSHHPPRTVPNFPKALAHKLVSVASSLLLEELISLSKNNLPTIWHAQRMISGIEEN